MRDVDVFEASQEPAGPLVERLEALVLDAIFAEQLLDDELGVEANGQTADSALFRGLQTEQQRGPFRDVVRGDAQVGVDLLDRLPGRVDQDGGARRRARIAA